MLIVFYILPSYITLKHSPNSGTLFVQFFVILLVTKYNTLFKACIDGYTFLVLFNFIYPLFKLSILFVVYIIFRILWPNLKSWIYVKFLDTKPCNFYETFSSNWYGVLYSIAECILLLLYQPFNKFKYFYFCFFYCFILF